MSASKIRILSIKTSDAAHCSCLGYKASGSRNKGGGVIVIGTISILIPLILLYHQQFPSTTLCTSISYSKLKPMCLQLHCFTYYSLIYVLSHLSYLIILHHRLYPCCNAIFYLTPSTFKHTCLSHQLFP